MMDSIEKAMKRISCGDYTVSVPDEVWKLSTKQIQALISAFGVPIVSAAFIHTERFMTDPHGAMRAFLSHVQGIRGPMLAIFYLLDVLKLNPEAHE